MPKYIYEHMCNSIQCMNIYINTYTWAHVYTHTSTHMHEYKHEHAWECMTQVSTYLLFKRPRCLRRGNWKHKRSIWSWVHMSSCPIWTPYKLERDTPHPNPPQPWQKHELVSGHCPLRKMSFSSVNMPLAIVGFTWWESTCLAHTGHWFSSLALE